MSIIIVRQSVFLFQFANLSLKIPLCNSIIGIVRGPPYLLCILLLSIKMSIERPLLTTGMPTLFITWSPPLATLLSRCAM